MDCVAHKAETAKQPAAHKVTARQLAAHRGNCKETLGTLGNGTATCDTLENSTPGRPTELRCKVVVKFPVATVC